MEFLYLYQEQWLQQVKAGVLLLSEDSEAPYRSSEDWAIGQQCVEFLSPLEELTRAISGQYYPTLSLRIPKILKAQKEIRRILVSSDDFHKKSIEFGWKLIESLDFYRYGARNVSTAAWSKAATAVDPRFKTVLFDGSEREDVKQTLCKLHDKLSENCSPSEDELDEMIGCDDPGWEFLEKEKRKYHVETKTPVKALADELEAFWKENGFVKMGEYVLKWWKQNRHRYPAVAELAQV